MNITILGAGITGLTSSLALQNHLPEPKPTITIYEIRDTPSTIGGAVNLTPKALRYLHYLGIDSRRLRAECKRIELFDLYSGRKYSEVDFRGADGDGIGKDASKRFYSARVLRRDLQAALLEAVEKQADTRTQIVLGKKVERTEERREEGDVQLTFNDGERVSCDLLLGCDGIHSATRTLLIDPDRQPTYTGICVCMATAQLTPEIKLKWETTGLASSRRGIFMASYFEQSRTQQYIAAVMEMKEVANRQGWKVRGSDQSALKNDILSRFKSASMPELEDLVSAAGEWSSYPVHMLPPGGKWSSPGGRVILLRDSLHAMPPQGESTGNCIEDAVLFSRAIMQHKTGSFSKGFKASEKVRRPAVDAAYTQAVQRWETVKDSGAFVYRFMTFLTPWFLWWTAKAREEEFAADYSDYDFVL